MGNSRGSPGLAIGEQCVELRKPQFQFLPEQLPDFRIVNRTIHDGTWNVVSGLIGQRGCCAGLEQYIVESGIDAVGQCAGAFPGHQYDSGQGMALLPVFLDTSHNVPAMAFRQVPIRKNYFRKPITGNSYGFLNTYCLLDSKAALQQCCHGKAAADPVVINHEHAPIKRNGFI